MWFCPPSDRDYPRVRSRRSGLVAALRALLLDSVLSMIGKREFGGFNLKITRDDLTFAAGFFESGVSRPYIDDTNCVRPPEIIQGGEAGHERTGGRDYVGGEHLTPSTLV
jgi:hypothetical protein